MSDRFLVVRVGTERFGIPLGAVREAMDRAEPRPVPTRGPAVRGVMPYRERFVSLVHLGALVSGTAAPEAAGGTVVIVELAGSAVALEVDDVETVVDRAASFVGPAPVAWATGVWRVGGDLVTVLDTEHLGERLTAAGSTA